MDSFAFIIHPINPKRDVSRKYPNLGKYLSVGAINFLSRFWPPLNLSHITGARSKSTGLEIEGWLIAVPYTSQRMLSLRPREVYRKIIAAGQLAESLGAKILGLGAYTSVVGDGGCTIARELDIPVTSGDSYTAALSVSSTITAADQVGIKLSEATVAIVGASGTIGSVVTQLLAPKVGQVLLVGRHIEQLESVAERIHQVGQDDIVLSNDVSDIRIADVVVTVTSSGGNLLAPDMLRAGAVVCDVSRPRDVSLQVAQQRDDVLVFDGGLVRVPGNVDFGFDYGPPPNLTYGCLAETMTLTFERQFVDYSVGKVVSLDRVKAIDAMATKHGFELAALRSFERKLDDILIQKVRNARLGGGG
jgi:fatty aldehyde-generating acyl-ACP reductase